MSDQNQIDDFATKFSNFIGVISRGDYRSTGEDVIAEFRDIVNIAFPPNGAMPEPQVLDINPATPVALPDPRMSQTMTEANLPGVMSIFPR